VRIDCIKEQIVIILTSLNRPQLSDKSHHPEEMTPSDHA
jgi:hypothetical protein